MGGWQARFFSEVTEFSGGPTAPVAMIPNPLVLRIALASVIVCLMTHATLAEQSSFQQAQEHYKQSNWQSALDLFLTTIQISDSTDNASSHFYAAECLVQLGRYPEAQSHYQEVLQSPDGHAFNVRAKFRRGEAEFLAGNLTDAEKTLREFIEKSPRDELCAAAFNRLGEIALQTGSFEQAISLFNYVIENFASDSNVNQACLGLARALLAANRLSEVSIALGRLCQSTDGTIAAEALLLLGRAKYDAGQFDQALIAFRRIYELQTEPSHVARARLASGWALWKLSRCEEIAAEVAPLTADARKSPEYRYLIGMAAYSTKDCATASQELAKAANIASVHRAAALFYLGESALRQQDFKAAKQAYQRVLDVEPTSEWADDAAWGLARTARAAKTKSDLANACEMLKARFPQSDYISRIPLLAAGSDVNPVETTPGIELLEEAVGHERDGNFDAALSVYHAFLDQQTTGGWLAEGLWRTARLHERLKQHTEATKFYERLLTEFPEFDRTPRVIASLAWMEAAKGNNAATTKLCEQLVAKFPQSSQAAEAAYWLALASADEKRSDDAQEYVDWLTAHRPNGDSLTAQQTQLWQQTLCLECQLLAEKNEWQSIVDLLDGTTKKTVNRNMAARLAFWRAEAALRLDQHEDARERFDALDVQCVGIFEPWVPMVSLRRAHLAARREDWQEVLSLIEHLDEHHPEFELAYESDYLHGRALAGRGEMSAARAAYGQVLENEWATGTETAAIAQWMIGETHFHQRNYELAAVAYERVIERHGLPEWQARAALQAGKCAELMEQWEEATALYAQAVERWQGTTSAKQLSARLRWTQEQLVQQQATLRR
jgi:cellulose synthase operon protein C